MNAEQLVESVRKHAKTVLLPSVAQAIVRELEVQKPPYTCIFCGAPSWVDPFDQEAPPDYCHASDHGEPPEQEAQPGDAARRIAELEAQAKCPPVALTWLFTHCRAIGMTCKSVSGKWEEDIALFTTNQKQRISKLEELLRVSGQAYEIAANMAEERDARIAELEAELTEARKDAERYRWLRHGDNDEVVMQRGPVDMTYHWLPRNERLDAIIDAAIAKEKSE